MLKDRFHIEPQIALYKTSSFSKNQSMLITGESGAGKTENTKKVVVYNYDKEIVMFLFLGHFIPCYGCNFWKEDAQKSFFGGSGALSV